MEWKKVADLPVVATTMQAVVIGNAVYVGGGVINEDDIDYHKAFFKYDSLGNEWSHLPKHSVRFCGLARFNDTLLTIGGVARHGPTNKVFTLTEEDWSESLEPLQTSRYYPSVLSTDDAIVVAGGASEDEDGDKIEVLSSVEIYSKSSPQWKTINPLPIPFYAMSNVIIDGMAYFFGGTTVYDEPIRSVFQVAVATLLEGVGNWKALTDTPMLVSMATSLGGQLLAVGGANDDGIVSNVYLYMDSTKSWGELSSGSLPEAGYGCAAVPLMGGLLLVGGMGAGGQKTSACYIGSRIV